MSLAVQIALTKLTNGKKKLAPNATLQLKVIEKRKRTALKVNHLFIYIFLLLPLREAWIKAARRGSFDEKGGWEPAALDRVSSIHFPDGMATGKNCISTVFWLWKQREEIKKNIIYLESN